MELLVRERFVDAVVATVALAAGRVINDVPTDERIDVSGEHTNLPRSDVKDIGVERKEPGNPFDEAGFIIEADEPKARYDAYVRERSVEASSPAALLLRIRTRESQSGHWWARSFPSPWTPPEVGRDVGAAVAAVASDDVSPEQRDQPTAG